MSRVPRLLILVVLAASSAIFGQTSLGPAQFSQDLRALVTQLPKLRVNLFFQTPEADFNAAAQQLQNDIPNLNQYQFYTRLSMLVALARGSGLQIFGTGYGPLDTKGKLP